MDGAEREDRVCDNTQLAVAQCWRGTLTCLGFMVWSGWLLTVCAWFAVAIRNQMWEERMEAGVQVTPACTWAPAAPSFEPVFEDPFEPLKSDGLLTPKRKPEPKIDLGEPGDLPPAEPAAVRVHLL